MRGDEGGGWNRRYYYDVLTRETQWTKRRAVSGVGTQKGVTEWVETGFLGEGYEWVLKKAGHRPVNSSQRWEV